MTSGGIPVIGLTVLLSLCACSQKQEPASSPSPASSEQAAAPPASVESQVFARGCAMIVTLLFLFAAVQTLLTPQKLWDERAYYGLKAIVLFQDHSVLSPDLAEPDFVQGHPRYPLLISLAEQHLYALLGRVEGVPSTGHDPQA